MLKLGILGNEKEFEFGIIINSQKLIRGSTHVMADGSNRVQYAVQDKYIFSIQITYVTETIWSEILEEVGNSKFDDLNFIDHEGNSYNVRFIPETLVKTPILGTALGYDVNFDLIEV